jgi:uncharacterized membrane protein
MKRKTGLHTPLTSLVTLLVACSGEPEPTAREREENLAANDVWHAAKLRGVAFRAIGQEPGWLLEITNGEEILLVTDYGSNRQSLPYVEPIVYQQERRTEYVLDSHATVVEIRGVRCTDTMSGESFEVSVTLFLDGKELHGCGRALF